MTIVHSVQILKNIFLFIEHFSFFETVQLIRLEFPSQTEPLSKETRVPEKKR